MPLAAARLSCLELAHKSAHRIWALTGANAANLLESAKCASFKATPITWREVEWVSSSQYVIHVSDCVSDVLLYSGRRDTSPGRWKIDAAVRVTGWPSTEIYPRFFLGFMVSLSNLRFGPRGAVRNEPLPATLPGRWSTERRQNCGTIANHETTNIRGDSGLLVSAVSG